MPRPRVPGLGLTRGTHRSACNRSGRRRSATPRPAVGSRRRARVRSDPDREELRRQLGLHVLGRLRRSLPRRRRVGSADDGDERIQPGGGVLRRRLRPRQCRRRRPHANRDGSPGRGSVRTDSEPSIRAEWWLRAIGSLRPTGGSRCVPRWRPAPASSQRSGYTRTTLPTATAPERSTSQRHTVSFPPPSRPTFTSSTEAESTSAAAQIAKSPTPPASTSTPSNGSRRASSRSSTTASNA